MDSFSHNASGSDKGVSDRSVPDKNSLKEKDFRSPQDFETALQLTTDFALNTFKQQIKSEQLYYHGLGHVKGVARRARLIFDTVVPFYQQAGYVPAIAWDRQRDLLQLSAIAHDMLQIFLPQSSPHTPRQRQSGCSEKATTDKLLAFIAQINQPPNAATNATAVFQPVFTAGDIALLQEAIEATVCQYDPADSSIYQPLLYSPQQGEKAPSLVARALALADLGTLGIEGITAYRREGRLLLLEENLDILPFFHHQASGRSTTNTAKTNKPMSDELVFDNLVFNDWMLEKEFKENLRQRLLKRAEFDVSFAKSRLARLETELNGLPVSAIAALKQHVFIHLTPATIQQLAQMIPTSANASLGELLSYFQFNT